MYRAGDLTIGDFWSIEKSRPELMSQNGGLFDEKYGISVVLENNDKGAMLVKHLAERANIVESCIEDIGKDADPLYRPQSIPKDRAIILNILKKRGYKGVEKYCRNQMGNQYYKEMIKEWKVVKVIRGIIKK